jgi:alkaline phosphatase D
MALSRRAFIRGAAASAAAWPLGVRGQDAGGEARLFRHGVASGDPLSDRVILWTRITPPAARSATAVIDVRWHVADDERFQQVIATGTTQAPPQRDFTVKVDAGNLRPGRAYFYAFEAGGERSPIGRTKTLPGNGTARVRLASVSCSNYPAGYFNVYRAVANRSDLDAVIHLGDYIYEFANGVYGDGTASGRLPLPGGEAVSLDDYRQRYATYRSDIDLQAAHRQHPFIVVWDDHELANDAWAGGAGNHDPSEGDWATRQAAAYRAYLEWMPVREAADAGIHLYRSFRLGDLADLMMLDTRGLRDRQLPAAEAAAMADPRRTLLGEKQEAWLFGELRQSRRDGKRWRLLGQQILLSSVFPEGVTMSPDMWDGYPAARRRLLDLIDEEQITDVAILTGDLHSSWALDVPANSRARADANGRSLAVELVTPAISSPPLFADAALRARAPLLRMAAPHLKYLEGDSRGYILLDITRARLQADWYYVPTVTERSPTETKGASFVCESGSMRLAPA